MLAGLALGVAVVTAIDMASQSALRSFEQSSESLVGRTTHSIVGGPSGVPAEIYREIRTASGTIQAAPVVEGVVSTLQRPLRILGIDLFAEIPFREVFNGERCPH